MNHHSRYPSAAVRQNARMSRPRRSLATATPAPAAAKVATCPIFYVSHSKKIRKQQKPALKRTGTNSPRRKPQHYFLSMTCTETCTAAASTSRPLPSAPQGDPAHPASTRAARPSRDRRHPRPRPLASEKSVHSARRASTLPQPAPAAAFQPDSAPHRFARAAKVQNGSKSPSTNSIQKTYSPKPALKRTGTNSPPRTAAHPPSTRPNFLPSNHFHPHCTSRHDPSRPLVHARPALMPPPTAAPATTPHGRPHPQPPRGE